MAETLSEAIQAFMLGVREGHINRPDAYTYLSPSDEPLSWDMKGLVRVDVGVHAVRLATARFAVKSFPLILEVRVEAMKKAAVEFVGATTAGFFLRLIVLKRLLGLIKTLYDLWSAAKIERETELALRGAMIATMREVLRHKMKPRSGQKRVTKRVASRHAK